MLLGVATGMGGGAVLTGIAKVIYSLYGMTGAIGVYFDDHIGTMKGSDNAMISQTGAVLEGAKFGFGLGYISSTIIIAVGQYLLGNTLSALSAVGTAMTLTNPIAMTCAAVGAIYYGWSALGSAQQNAIIESVTRGLEVGVELIKSVVQFLISKTRELMSSQTLVEFKALVKEYAGKFGKTLYDVTGKMGDFVAVAAEKVGELSLIAGEAATSAVGSTTTALKVAMNKTGEVAVSAAGSTSEAFKEAYEKTGDAAANLASSAKQTLGWKKAPDASSENLQKPT